MSNLGHEPLRPSFELGRGSLVAYLQLLRLPNVFTAIANIMLGYVFTHGGGEPAYHLRCS